MRRYEPGAARLINAGNDARSPSAKHDLGVGCDQILVQPPLLLGLQEQLLQGTCAIERELRCPTVGGKAIASTIVTLVNDRPLQDLRRIKAIKDAKSIGLE